jgi:hypothetical protein
MATGSSPSFAPWSGNPAPRGRRDHADIRNVLRQRVDTVYHPVGTCKMGVNDAMAVMPQDHDRREGRRHDPGRVARRLMSRQFSRKPPSTVTTLPVM